MAYKEIRDLVGGDEDEEELPPLRPGVRPDLAIRRVHARASRMPRSDREHDIADDLITIKDGVTITWLASLYDMARKTVESKLTGCPIKKRTASGTPLYDLTVAAGYLSGRRRDIMAALKVAKEDDLPLPLQQKFWRTKLLRNKWELDAGQLWRTDDVLDVFSEAFKAIKNSMLLWVDNLEMIGMLTKEQREFMHGQVDGLTNEIHEILMTLPRRRRTQSLRAAQEPEIEKLMNDEVISEDDDV